MLFRSSDLNRLGGLPVVKDLLAEDYVLGQAFKSAGLRVALCGHPVLSVAGARSVRSFFDRHLRWSQMRRRISPWYYLGEPLLLPTPWFLLAAFDATVFHASPKAAVAATFALLLLALRAVAEVVFARRLRGESPELAAVPLVILKDLVVLAAWWVGWFKTTTAWRGTEFRIGRGSILTPLAPESVAHDAVEHVAH